MKKESDDHDILDLFLLRYGIPEALVSDGAKAVLFKKKAKEVGIFCKIMDPYILWQNRAEGEIREGKKLAGRWMVQTLYSMSFMGSLHRVVVSNPVTYGT
jgi:hypothetical protein